MLINNPLDFPEAIGYAVARADEGLLLIPYSEVTLDSSWEQLDLDHAILIPEPPRYLQAATAFQQAEDALIVMLTEALDRIPQD